MKIDPSEVILTGNWTSDCQGSLVADDTCGRIDSLVRSHLKELGRDETGWDALYRDPGDGRLWELIYRRSELHGGGPPQLRLLTVDEARQNMGALSSQDDATSNFADRS